MSAGAASDEGNEGMGPAAAAPDEGDDEDDDDDNDDDVWYRLSVSRAVVSSATSCAFDCSIISTLHWKCLARALYFALTCRRQLSKAN